MQEKDHQEMVSIMNQLESLLQISHSLNETSGGVDTIAYVDDILLR